MYNYGTAGPKSNLIFFFINYMSVVSAMRTDFFIENKLFEIRSKNCPFDSRIFETFLLMRTIFTKIICWRNRYAQRKLHLCSL